MSDRKCLGIIEIKLKGEVYSRRYALKDIQMVVDLVNEMFPNEIEMEIVEAKERILK